MSDRAARLRWVRNVLFVVLVLGLLLHRPLNFPVKPLWGVIAGILVLEVFARFSERRSRRG